MPCYIPTPFSLAVSLICLCRQPQYTPSTLAARPESVVYNQEPQAFTGSLTSPLSPLVTAPDYSMNMTDTVSVSTVLATTTVTDAIINAQPTIVITITEVQTSTETNLYVKGSTTAPQTFIYSQTTGLWVFTSAPSSQPASVLSSNGFSMLSGGAIAFIVIGSLLFFGILIALAIILRRKRKTTLSPSSDKGDITERDFPASPHSISTTPEGSVFGGELEQSGAFEIQHTGFGAHGPILLASSAGRAAS